MHWRHPVLFQEKMQWLKLHDRKSIYTDMVDKFKVKSIVSQLIGEDYIIPTLGVWDCFEDIDFTKLPNQFVLKCTHDSGGLVIVKDKDCFDRRAARDKIVKSMSRNFYLIGREWPYKNVKRRIIAEVFLKCDGMEDLVDYKFYCFNGTPLFCQVICNRSSDETIDFYDMDWKHQSFSGLTSARLSSHEFPRPHNFSKMREIAMLLSANLPFVRVDLYNIRGKIYFGESALQRDCDVAVLQCENLYYDARSSDAAARIQQQGRCG